MRVKRLILFSFLAGMLASVNLDTAGARASLVESVTFNKQVVRILQQHCQACHHDGDIAPFALVTYDQAKLFAEAIQEATESRQMPPWKASPECGAFDGDRRLSDEEIDTLARWIEQGKPEGDPADLPQPLQFSNDWTLGQPDLVLQPEASFDVELGADLYRCFSFPTDSRGDRFLSAIDVKPDARSVVHHAVVYLDEKGESQALDDRDPAPGFDCPNNVEFTKSAIGWWVPGEVAHFETEGTGWRIPKGARLVLKIHYHVHHGGAQKDRTQVGLYYARAPIKKELHTLSLSNITFAIPAGDSHYQVTASYPPLAAGQSAHALAIAPHMQLLGREMEVEAAFANSSTRCLISAEDWDAHWQRLYTFAEPVALPAGTRLNLTATYDNSRNNPENPNFPLTVVHYGEHVEDETCLAFVKYTLDQEEREVSSPRISDVSVDTDGQLVVAGKGFLGGADIEIDGKRLGDTRNHKKKAGKRLLSSDNWKALLVTGKQASITVLNPDGARSSAFPFVR